MPTEERLDVLLEDVSVFGHLILVQFPVLDAGLILRPQRVGDHLQGLAGAGLGFRLTAVDGRQHVGVDKRCLTLGLVELLFLCAALAGLAFEEHAELPVAAGRTLVEDGRGGQPFDLLHRGFDWRGSEFLRHHALAIADYGLGTLRHLHPMKRASIVAFGGACKPISWC